jgi:general stress protein 26
MSPTTTFDRQFSDPAAVAVEWEDARAALAASEVLYVCTVRTDGRPHVTPVVGVWADDAIWFATGSLEQKFANLRHNPQVVVMSASREWERDLDVVVEGQAARVIDDAVLDGIAGAFADRWDGRWRYIARDGALRDPDGSGEAMVFKITPSKAFAHSKGDPFGQTRYRF